MPGGLDYAGVGVPEFGHATGYREGGGQLDGLVFGVGDEIEVGVGFSAVNPTEIVAGGELHVGG